MTNATISSNEILPGPRQSVRPLRIGIDAHGVGGHSKGHGNETYFKNLITNLLAIDDCNEYHIFVNHPESLEEPLAGCPNAKRISLFPHNQWIQRPVSIPLYVRKHNLDLIHFPFTSSVKARTVVTVHDIYYEVYPEYFRKRDLWRMKWLVPKSCANADCVFTVSEHARKQIHEHYGTPLDKIVVTYNAADQFQHRTPSGPPSRKLDLPEHFILYVGQIQPKKNLVRLVQAFDRLKSRHDIPHHLVLGGAMGWMNQELMRVLKDLPSRDKIHLTGYLSEADVQAALPLADLFVFPSVFESFGIPPLEAQQCRVPVLVSNSTCFPEIFGDSAHFCDPMDVESIARGMEQVLLDQNLRESLVRRGSEWAQRYTWRNSARIALDAYRNICKNDEPRA